MFLKLGEGFKFSQHIHLRRKWQPLLREIVCTCCVCSLCDELLSPGDRLTYNWPPPESAPLDSTPVGRAQSLKSIFYCNMGRIQKGFEFPSFDLRGRTIFHWEQQIFLSFVYIALDLIERVIHTASSLTFGISCWKLSARILESLSREGHLGRLKHPLLMLLSFST